MPNIFRIAAFATLLLLGTGPLTTAIAWSHWYDVGRIDGADGAHRVVFPLSKAEPNPKLTTGEFDPRITKATIHQTICVPGYSRSVRPPESYTEPLKRMLVKEYGYNDRRMWDYELDHDAPIGLGGAPADPRNLWPEPHNVVGGWGSYAKDRLEVRLHTLVCRDQVPLRQAQYGITHNWIAAYKKYIGLIPNDTPMRWMRRDERRWR